MIVVYGHVIKDLFQYAPRVKLEQSLAIFILLFLNLLKLEVDQLKDQTHVEFGKNLPMFWR